ncbi:MAG: alpha/beta hydrolase [Planctomycetaceae bacterium]|nr:alpha/beta hydrolase [Planctomycetaceae bacterium]
MKRSNIQRFGKLLLLTALIGCLGYVPGKQAFAAERPLTARSPHGEDAIRQTDTPGDVVLDESEEGQAEPSYVYLENPDRDVWLLNTRSASPTNPSEQQFQRITVQHFIQMYEREKSHWKDSTFDEFWETFDANVPLIVLVHGNYTSKTDAIASANMLENKFFPGVGKFADAKYRLVIWTWPTESVLWRRLPDAKMKGYYAIKQGEYLAHFLSLVPEGSRVSLVGFSFGARTTCEAVQQFSKDFSEEKTALPFQIRNLLLAPAIDHNSLAPKFRYGEVLAVSQHLIVLFNSQDYALKFYPFLSGFGGPRSLGREGVPISRIPAELRGKITGINVQPFAKSRHSFVTFFQNPDLNRRLGDYLLFE